MRNYHKHMSSSADHHQLLTGPDMEHPLHQVNVGPRGGSLAEVHALGVAPGQWEGRSGKASYDLAGPQAGVSLGGFGVLKRAGRP
jgi:hypothetical protein